MYLYKTYESRYNHKSAVWIIQTVYAPVAQGIEHRPPEPGAGVRISPGALFALSGMLKGCDGCMPLRYKKLIWIFTLAIMLIGMGTFSLLAPEINFSFASTESGKSDADLALEGKSEKEIEEELNDLIQKYFDAKLQVDMDALGKYVSDVSHIDEKKLVAEAEYIEAYNNISCTIFDGAEKASYRIYVYHEDKYYDINTTIPSLTGLYVKAVKGGKFAVYTGTLSAKEQDKLEELDQSADVIALRDQVNQKLDTLIASDQQVKEFYEMLESSGVEEEEGTENIEQEAGSAAAPTQAPAAPTQVPGAPTQAPGTPTQAPAAPTQAPAAPTQVPAAPTQAPAAPTNAPAQ